MTVDDITAQLKILARQEKEKARACEAAGDAAGAATHWARSLTAKNGRLLNRPEEYRDPSFSMEYQHLRTHCFKLGLTTEDPYVKVKGAVE